MCSCATGWFSSHVFFGVVSILIALRCWCVHVLHAHIYIREPSLHCQPAAAVSTSRILILPVVPCVCRSHSGSFCFIVLFLSQTDNFFTPHQRRLSPAGQHLSALSRFSIFPFLLCLFFPFHLTCLSSTQLHLTSCTESQICTLEKKINTLSSVQTVSVYSVLSLLF